MGETATLTWEASHASEISVEPDIGNVESRGSREVNPSGSLTYRARAEGPGGSAHAEARLTVIERTPVSGARPLSDEEYFEAHIRDVFFDYDRHEIRSDARPVLIANAKALADRVSIQLTIEGHCDERGSERYNLALGDRRASAVRQFLELQGVSPGRLDAVSYGENRPVCTDSNESCWQSNRRAHHVRR
ncbi:MAG: peptidoglycan-associated lipoprotein Pal [Acidobacteriota bacterium]